MMQAGDINTMRRARRNHRQSVNTRNWFFLRRSHGNKFFAPELAVIVSSVCILFPGADVASAGTSTNSMSKVSFFLQNPPPVERIVFLVEGNGVGDDFSLSKTQKLYVASIQGSSFAIAELKALNDVPVLSPVRRLPIAGRDGISRWSILGQSIFLSSTNAVGSALTDGAKLDSTNTVSEGLEAQLNKILNLGIFHVDYGKLTVNDNGEFTGPLSRRLVGWGGYATISGEFSFSATSGGLSSATWKVSSHPELLFRVDYLGSIKDEPSILPKIWATSVKRNGANMNVDRVEILGFDVAGVELPRNMFQPERFIDSTNNFGVGPLRVVQSSGNTVWLRDGKWVSAVNATPNVSTRGKLFLRYAILGFALIGLWLIVRLNSLKRSKK